MSKKRMTKNEFMELEKLCDYWVHKLGLCNSNAKTFINGLTTVLLEYRELKDKQNSENKKTIS